jgi:hypothetical protein
MSDATETTLHDTDVRTAEGGSVMAATASGVKWRISLVLVQKPGGSVWVATGLGHAILCPEVLSKYFGVEDYTRAELVLSQTPSEDAYEVWAGPALESFDVNIRVGHRIEKQNVYSYFFEEVELFCSETGKKTCWASLELVCGLGTT